VEGMAPSKMEKETAHWAGASNVESPATQDGLNPLLEVKTLDDGDDDDDDTPR
jgi:hypothetical protein